MSPPIEERDYMRRPPDDPDEGEGLLLDTLEDDELDYYAPTYTRWGGAWYSTEPAGRRQLWSDFAATMVVVAVVGALIEALG